MKTDIRLDKLTGPAGIFAGYCLAAAGIITAFSHPLSLILVVPGLFIATTYDGTVIDRDKRRIKSYICLFGVIRTGKWHSINEFTGFRIKNAHRRYTSYSRANIPLTIEKNEIRLILMSKGGSPGITAGKFNNFEEARKEMSAMIDDMNMTGMKEWI